LQSNDTFIIIISKGIFSLQTSFDQFACLLRTALTITTHMWPWLDGVQPLMPPQMSSPIASDLPRMSRQSQMRSVKCILVPSQIGTSALTPQLERGRVTWEIINI